MTVKTTLELANRNWTQRNNNVWLVNQERRRTTTYSAARTEGIHLTRLVYYSQKSICASNRHNLQQARHQTHSNNQHQLFNIYHMYSVCHLMVIKPVPCNDFIVHGLGVFPCAWDVPQVTLLILVEDHLASQKIEGRLSLTRQQVSKLGPKSWVDTKFQSSKLGVKETRTPKSLSFRHISHQTLPIDRPHTRRHTDTSSHQLTIRVAKSLAAREPIVSGVV